MIHPSAHIHPEAQLGQNVKVGPGAIIEAECVIGDECEIRAHAVITGFTIMGPRNQIGYGAIIGAEPQDVSFKGGRSGVEIGAQNIIREYATIHRGTAEGTFTRIGNGNFLMGGTHLAHNCTIGNGVILVNNSLLAGYVQVEDRAFLGGASLVHQHVRIGTLSITRGGTRIGKDLPPFFMAVDTNQVSGLNRVGLRRAGFSPEIRREIQAAFDVLYKSQLNVTQALEALQTRFTSGEVIRLIEFIRQSKRGICRYCSGSSESDQE